MNNQVKEIELAIKTSIVNIKEELEKIKPEYTSLFVFDNMFTTESSGKTKLNRDYYNEVHTIILNHIHRIKDYLLDVLEEIRDTIVSILEQNGFKDIQLDKNLIYDDASFHELFMMDLDLMDLPRLQKKELIESLDTLTIYKNKIYTLKYFISMFDTTPLNKHLNKLGMDDLINSRFIFELIDSYSLEYEELKRFEETLDNFDSFDKETKSLSKFDGPVEIIKRRIDNYVYDNVRYKISLEYENQVKTLKKSVDLSIAYLENIIVNFIEQSCLDLIKKELKRGKISKLIELRIIQTKNSIQLIVKNNGFEEKNIHMMYLGTAGSTNSYIVEARNLARMIGGTVDISTLDEKGGMQYILDLKI